MASSVYENCEFGRLDRLRLLLRREDRGGELIVGEDGEPQLVVAKGRPTMTWSGDPPGRMVARWRE